MTVKYAVKSGKFLTFSLAGEEYGLEILKVQEIIGMMDVTKLPRTPDYVRGVVNLPGRVIPVVDLRLKFGINAQEDTEKTCIIVVQISNQKMDLTIGIIVDEVSEVLDIYEGQMEPPPSFGSNIDINFIFGMGKVGENVVSLLDIDKVFSEDEITY
jgi:purine-binding chemotaxis protein CheW